MKMISFIRLGRNKIGDIGCKYLSQANWNHICSMELSIIYIIRFKFNRRYWLFLSYQIKLETINGIRIMQFIILIRLKSHNEERLSVSQPI